MSPDGAYQLLASLWSDDQEPHVDRPSLRDYAVLEELSFIRREAQAEADLAYEDWRQRPCRDAYTVYVAARDRADAAQDALADWAKQIAA
jgi:hypothetical protein